MKNRIPYSDAVRTHGALWRVAISVLLGALAFLPTQATRAEVQATPPTSCIVISPTSLSLEESGALGEYEAFLRTTLSSGETVYVVPRISNPDPNVTVSISPQVMTFAASDIPNDDGIVRKKFRVTVIPDTDSVGGTLVISNVVIGVGTDCDLEGGSVTLTVSDRGAPVRAVNVSETSLTTVESYGSNEGLSADYALNLATIPSARVSIVVMSSDTLAVGVSPKILEFTQDNWFEQQTLTVTAVNDDDGNDENVTISHTASGGGYDDVVIAEVDVFVVDPDPFVPVPGATISLQDVNLHEGTSSYYTIRLDKDPSEKVYIVVRSTAPAAITVSPTVLEFLPGPPAIDNALQNWRTPHKVTVEAVQDDNAISEKVVIDHIAIGGEYSDVAVRSIVANVWDDEARSVTLSESQILINEGESATYTVGLDAFPLNTVVITITTITPTSDPPDKLSVSPETLRFTTSTWHLPQTVTLTALRDADRDSHPVTLTHEAQGGGYDKVPIADIFVLVADTGTVTGVEDADPTVPTDFALEGNYPNPFNPATEIAYALPQQVHVTLTVYDVSGREVRRLVDTAQAPGRYRVRWDGKNARGHSVRSGVYFYRLATDVWRKTQSMVLLK